MDASGHGAGPSADGENAEGAADRGSAAGAGPSADGENAEGAAGAIDGARAAVARSVAKAVAIAEARPGALLVVVGPTASGKTDVAIGAAEALDGEIVSADSVQVYRHFDVGSGKPSASERARAAHHLVDVADPLEPIDAARFVALADRAIADIQARGRRPVVCGGTFLWTRALLFGLADAPAADAALRRALMDEAARDGRAALHARLAAVDPASAARLHPNDFVRVSRALEVFALTGRPQSEGHGAHGFARARHDAVLVAVERPPAELDARIAARVDGWLASGWIDEVRGLVARGYRDARAMGSVGYRQVAMHVDGQCPEPELAASIVRATRVFARRQRTWLRRAPDLVYV